MMQETENRDENEREEKTGDGFIHIDGGDEASESDGTEEAGQQQEAGEEAAEPDRPKADGDGGDETAQEEDGGTAEQDGAAEADDGTEEDGDAEADDAKKSKKGFFKKAKDKRDEQLEELTDRLKRQMAEFDNFRKRSEKEKSQMFDMGARSVIEKILPVVDNFERGFAMVEETDKDDAFVDGMDKVYKQLMTELEAIGVAPIECVGKEFDPELHNAVMQVESEEYESGIVAQELQKGYTYKDTVVRHSMVGVVS